MITQLQTYYRVALLEQSMQRVLKRIRQRRAKKMQKEKEHLRKAWSNGRMFDMEQYKNRSVDTDIKDVPDKALKFEEWFSRHYS